MNLFDDSGLVFAIVYLNGPREKYWGILNRNTAVGIWLTGSDLNTVQDWLDRGGPEDDPLPIFTTTFFPMHRVEKIVVDEGNRGIPSIREALAARLGDNLLELLPGSFNLPGEIQ
jgi:hypothetical protein